MTFRDSDIVAMTIGVSQPRPPHAVSLDELVRSADKFLYERKHRSA